MTRSLFVLLAFGCTGGSDKDATDTGSPSDTDTDADADADTDADTDVDTDTDISTLPECTMQDPGFAACLAGGPDPKTAQTPYQEKVYGSQVGDVEVVDVGDHLAASCADGWGVGLPAVSLSLDQDAEWIQVEHPDGSLATMGVKAPGFDLSALPVGTELSYDFASAEFAWSPAVGHLELRDASGALLLWLAEGGQLADLTPPPEVFLLRGDTTCWTESECVGGWQQNGLIVETGGAYAQVQPHSAVDVGAMHVVHGRFDEQTGQSKCPDAYVADIKIALWPL